MSNVHMLCGPHTISIINCINIDSIYIIGSVFLEQSIQISVNTQFFRHSTTEQLSLVSTVKSFVFFLTRLYLILKHIKLYYYLIIMDEKHKACVAIILAIIF